MWIIAGYGKGAFWRADELVRTYSEAQTGCPVTFYYSFAEVQRGLADGEVVALELPPDIKPTKPVKAGKATNNAAMRPTTSGVAITQPSRSPGATPCKLFHRRQSGPR